MTCSHWEKNQEKKMKKLIIGFSLISSFTAYAQFSQPGIPENGLRLKCRTTQDVVAADYNKDGRLFISATIRTNEALLGVTFKINKTSNFTKSYISKTKNLVINEIQMGDRFVKFIDSYSDSKFSFSITQLPMDFDNLANRIDTFSANVGILENPGTGGFAKNYELRCVVEHK
jgi:hypothetical protein